MTEPAKKLSPEAVGQLLDDVRWYFSSYLREANAQVVMSRYDVERAEPISYALDKLTPRERTVLHLATGGWGPKGQLIWRGLDHFQGFGAIVLGLESTHYFAHKAGAPVLEYCRALTGSGDKALRDELIQDAKEHVQVALLEFRRHRFRLILGGKTTEQ